VKKRAEATAPPFEPFASKQNNTPSRETQIQRYRDFWAGQGNMAEVLPGVRKALALTIRCTEEEAETLLRAT